MALPADSLFYLQLFTANPVHTAMKRTSLCILTALLFCSTAPAMAQPLRFYLGPTFGVTTPGLRSDERSSEAMSPDFVHEERTPVVSPLLGLSTGFNLFNRVGLDAGLHYSYTGYRYSYEFASATHQTHYDERMTLHKLSIPVTLGYGVGIGRARLRLGAGIAYTWYFDGRFRSEETIEREGSAPEHIREKIDLVKNSAGYSPVYPRQIHPRLSLSFAPVKRLIIGLAGTLGYDVTLPQEGTEATLNRSEFSTHALDATVTWSLR